MKEHDHHMTNSTTPASADLAAREAAARRAVAEAAHNADRLRELAHTADDAADKAEVQALKQEMNYVLNDLREARDAAVAELNAVLNNPKATLIALATATLDADEAQNVIHAERRAINYRLDQIAPLSPGGYGVTGGAPRVREYPGTPTGHSYTPFDETLDRWLARHVPASTLRDDLASARAARIAAVREAAVAEAVAAS